MLIRLHSLKKAFIHEEIRKKANFGLTFYSMLMLLTPLKYHNFENNMEKGAFAPKEQMFYLFSIILTSIQNLT